MQPSLVAIDEASTPLAFEERQGLIPSYITLRHELNEAERLNILTADAWAFRRKRDILNEKFLLTLHRRMFKDVWKWAGKFRSTPRNMGIEHWLIPTSLRQLLDDCAYWTQMSTYPADEIAARFHHRLVLIHPFPNGNGRHARLSADLLAISLGKERLTWGRADLVSATEVRRFYIEALRAADRHDIGPLIQFVRS